MNIMDFPIEKTLLFSNAIWTIKTLKVFFQSLKKTLEVSKNSQRKSLKVSIKTQYQYRFSNENSQSLFLKVFLNSQESFL